jgi:hypothetical protein
MPPKSDTTSVAFGDRLPAVDRFQQNFDQVSPFGKLRPKLRGAVKRRIIIASGLAELSGVVTCTEKSALEHVLHLFTLVVSAEAQGLPRMIGNYGVERKLELGHLGPFGLVSIA